jgi:hypothetical protein
MPRPPFDAKAIAARLETLCTTELCPRCLTAAIPVAAGTAELLTEVTRLQRGLRAARLESANRLAAMRAALHAAQDGEADPLAYLRDELPSPDSQESAGSGRRGR